MSISSLPLRTQVLDALRSPLRRPGIEACLVMLTRGKPYAPPLSKVVPNCHTYHHPTVRRVRRHGLELELDLSDLIQWYLYFGFVDPSIEALVALIRPGDVVLDVGANQGFAAMRMAKASGAHGRVVSFEPDPRNYKKLVENLQRNRITSVSPIQKAAGDQPGELPLVAPSTVNSGMNRLERGATPPGESVLVSVTTVDTVVDELGLSRVNLLKIDTEGYEMFALRGASDVIKRHRPTLFIELDDGLLRRNAVSSRDVITFLVERGYAIRVAETGEPVRVESAMISMHCDVIATPQD